MEKLKIILDNINIENKTIYEGYELVGVEIKEQKKVTYVHLHGKDIIKYSDLKKLEIEIMNFFSDILVNNEIVVYYTYDMLTLNDEILQDYYNSILDDLEKRSSRLGSLKTLNNVVEKDNIKFFVANDREASVFNELLDVLKVSFRRYGLGFVKIECCTSSFETPILEEIQKINRMNTETIINEELARESQTKPVEQTETKVRGMKRPRMQTKINGTPTPLKDIPTTDYGVNEYSQKHDDCEFVITGEIVACEIREIKTFKLYVATMFDGEDSIIIKTFIPHDKKVEDYYRNSMVKGTMARVFGVVAYDKFERDVVLNIKDSIVYDKAKKNVITDQATSKRVELHAHTKMSAQDAVMDVKEYVTQCAEYGHTALAITDHFNVQALPDLEKEVNSINKERKLDIKPIFGLEANLVDEDDFRIALTDDDFDLYEKTYVVYDFETTGFSSIYHEIIEIGAVKVYKGSVIDRFSYFIKPKKPISLEITNLTSITNDLVRNADPVEVVLPKFVEFIGDSCLVAHNATFDNSHLYSNMKRLGIFQHEYPTIDTLQLARVRYSKNLKRFRLDNLAKFFGVELTQHHRAVDDAEATAGIFIKMMNDFLKDDINKYGDINKCINPEEAYKLIYPSHITILCRNEVGKKNMNKIVSDSHTVHFHQTPRLLKSYLNSHREGLLIGSGCYNGDIFDTAYRKGYDELLEKVKFYDFLEVQPPEVYSHMVKENGDPDTMSHIKSAIKRIIQAGKDAGILVCATGDVHHLHREDLKFREIFIDAPQVGGGHHDLYGSKVGSQHYRSTIEMLNDFNFLDDSIAFEIVVTNTNIISNMIERFPLFPKKLFAPEDDFLKDKGIPSIKVKLRDLCYETARSIYGDKIHPLIIDRLEKELHSIINNEFSSNYYVSHMLVKHSTDSGYVVGSRGSVGSSLTATFMKITEVNSLPPHYICPKCHFTAFKMTAEQKEKYGQTPEQLTLEKELQGADCGCDLPDRVCPVCGEKLQREGFDIPFETFLGFHGEKVPDIDLNFSGDFQPRAHEFCREVFGVDHAFRAGTIGTIAEKTAYGYVKGWLERQGKTARNAEIERLSKKIVGVKRSTGQHPGGIVVVPKSIEYTDVIPVQYPADEVDAAWRTSHYDYHKFESNLLKFDILGHDDPTMIRHLMNFVEEFPEEFPFSKVEDIPLADKEVLSLFSSVEALKIEPSQVHNDTIGTTGLPEFGTSIAKGMLCEIKPKTVADLVKISGLSHGTDVWAGNARDYMLGLKPGVSPIPFKELIGCRDDIMVYLINKGLPAEAAFEIMEKVRKGKGVAPNFEKMMREYNVPEWYIDSCKLIKYMFPKAHAAAYVIMALRIGWFKVHRPIYYYAGFFSRRCDQYNVDVMVGGWASINARISELDEKIAKRTISTKESDEYSTLLLALEMTARGYRFEPINIEKSDYRDFLVTEDKKSLIIPFKALESLGENTAKSIVEARKEAPFTSKKDIMRRTKLNNTVFERMDQMGIFDGLPNDDQLGLFNL